MTPYLAGWIANPSTTAVRNLVYFILNDVDFKKRAIHNAFMDDRKLHAQQILRWIPVLRWRRVTERLAWAERPKNGRHCLSFKTPASFHLPRSSRISNDLAHLWLGGRHAFCSGA